MAAKAQSATDINFYNGKIYDQAREGTAVNPDGLPSTLANLVVAQARHETGNYSSNAFVKHNNAFGYSYVAGGKYQTGPGLVADNGQPVAAYATIDDSVREIVDWIYRRRKEGKFPQDLNQVRTPEQYATLLKSAGYYGDTLSNYLTAIKKFFKDGGPVASMGGVVLVAATIWLFIRK